MQTRRFTRVAVVALAGALASAMPTIAQSASYEKNATQPSQTMAGGHSKIAKEMALKATVEKGKMEGSVELITQGPKHVRYDVVGDAKGKELAGLVGKSVSVKGTASKGEKGVRMFTVQSFEEAGAAKK